MKAFGLEDFITGDDIVRGGACPEGVARWRQEHDVTATAIRVGTALALSTEEERPWIEQAVGLAGDGDGYGGYGGDGDGGDGDGGEA